MYYDDEKRPEDENNRPAEDENNSVPENGTEPEKKPEEKNENYSGYNGYGHYEPEKKPENKKSEGYMSKKTVGWIVALCLVVSIVCGVCANAVTGALRGNVGETTTENGGAAVTTTGAINDSTTTDDTVITPISTDGATAIPTVTVSENDTTYTSIADVAEKCINSVVQIEITKNVTSVYYGTYEQTGAGSGVIYSADGYIVTNYHVVGNDTKTIKVILYDGSTYEGQFICGDESADISIIKISKNDCQAAKIADSSTLRLGENVVAIGNPLGYGLTVTEGIISAKSRTITVENTTMILMQTTAAINSGNSGGGLFNMKGELVGITNAKIGGTSVESMGYAIPSEKVIKCISDFSKYGYLTGVARLGVTVSDKITIGMMSYSGYVFVQKVSEGGSAEKAGILANDIIYSIDGKEFSSYATLTEILTKYKVGDTVTIKLLRPSVALSSSVNYNSYIRSCEDVTVTLTFVEFNPASSN